MIAENDLEKQYQERKAWFIERIGKIVFRNDNLCSCEICKHITENGLLIADRDHAIYLLDVEGCSAEDPKHRIMYFDTKEEAAEFELKKSQE